MWRLTMAYMQGVDGRMDGHVTTKIEHFFLPIVLH